MNKSLALKSHKGRIGCLQGCIKIVFHYGPVTGTKNCPGCDQMFQWPKANCQSSFEYVVHVIEECAKYKELNLITECQECNFKFPTQQSYHHHESLVHSTKPDWMPSTIYKSRNLKGPTESVPCPGCGSQLQEDQGTTIPCV